MKYQIGDKIFNSKEEAMSYRQQLNEQIRRAKNTESPINLINRVYRNNGRWTVRGCSLRK